MRRLFVALALGAMTFNSGCVAIAIPVMAGAAIGGKHVLGGGTPGGGDGRAVALVQPAPVPAPQASPAPGAGVLVQTKPADTGLSSGDRFLFGSGEAAALSNQAYNQLTHYLRARADDRIAGYPVPSVILAPGSTLAHPTFEDCGQKPLAVVLDIDETSVLNLGYEADAANRGLGYDPDRWDRWEATGGEALVALPGVASAINKARSMGITVIFNSNRTTTHAQATADMLADEGLGLAVLDKTLFLREPGASGEKDARRAVIAKRYCVVAMAGDQLGDFSDLFNAKDLTTAQRRAAANGDQFGSLWGEGWFILPNPVYGTGLAGGLDDVFPADKRWTDPGPAAPAPVPTPVP